MKRLVLVLAAVVSVLLAVTAPSAASRADGLLGTRVNLTAGTGLEVSSSDWSYVMHGMGSLYWSDATAEDRIAFLDDDLFRFELTLDGAPVSLHRVVSMESSPDGWLLKLFYVQFKPGDLAPGSYTLVGNWWVDWDRDGIAAIGLTFTRVLVVTS